MNGSVLPVEQAKLSVFDHGYMYGLGIFETFRIYDGHPFLLDDHFRRLKEGLLQLGIQWSMEKEAVYTVLEQLLKENKLHDAYVRWNVSAGVEDLGLYTGIYEKPTTVVYMKSLPSSMAQHKKAQILDIRRNTPEGSFRLKSHHYLNNVLAKREIGDNVNVEGIFLSQDGYVAEGIVSNVFWVKGGTVYTPSLETGILNGVTRQFILKLLQKEGISYVEGLFNQQALLEADEAFVTNSIQEVLSLTSCNHIEFPTNNPITTWLQKQYAHARKLLISKDEL